MRLSPVSAAPGTETENSVTTGQWYMSEKRISEPNLQAISEILGEPDEGLAIPEIVEILDICRIKDEFAEETAEQRLFKAVSRQQSKDGHRRAILAFMRVAMNPERYVGEQDKFERRRIKLNEALAMCGLQVQEDGTLIFSPGTANDWFDTGLEGLPKALWRGRVPLVKTFWLFGVLGRLILRIPFFIAESSYLLDYNFSMATAAVVLLYSMVRYAYVVFICVAIWRSAGYYKRDRFWSISARIYVVISLVFLGVEILSAI